MQHFISNAYEFNTLNTFSYLKCEQTSVIKLFGAEVSPWSAVIILGTLTVSHNRSTFD